MLGEVCSSTVALAAATRVFSVKSAVFKQILQGTPQLQQILFKDISQQLAASQATSQVQCMWQCNSSALFFYAIPVAFFTEQPANQGTHQYVIKI